MSDEGEVPYSKAHKRWSMGGPIFTWMREEFSTRLLGWCTLVDACVDIAAQGVALEPGAVERGGENRMFAADRMDISRVNDCTVRAAADSKTVCHARQDQVHSSSILASLTR